MDEREAIEQITKSLETAAQALMVLAKAYNEKLAAEPKAVPKKKPEPSKPKEPPAPQVTLDEVRTLLAAKAAAGHRDEVKAIVEAEGVKKLSEVDPAHFAAMKEKAEAL